MSRRIRSLVSACVSSGHFALGLTLLSLATVMPGRRGLSLQEGGRGSAPWEVFWVGVGLDVEFQVVLFFVLFLVASLVASAVARGEQAVARRRTFFVATMAVAAPIFLLFHVSASEFMYQRGAYPTRYDVLLGLRYLDAAAASAPAVFFERYRSFEILFLALWAALLAGWWRGLFALPRTVAEHLAATAWVAAVSVTGFQIYRKAENIFPSISDSGVVSSPFRALVQTLGRRDAIEGYQGLRTLLTSRVEELTSSGVDGSLVGFPERISADCVTHPLARPIPGSAPPTERAFRRRGHARRFAEPVRRARWGPRRVARGCRELSWRRCPGHQSGGTRFPGTVREPALCPPRSGGGHCRLPTF